MFFLLAPQQPQIIQHTNTISLAMSHYTIAILKIRYIASKSNLLIKCKSFPTSSPMDLDSFILHLHCLYRVRSLSFLILKTRSIKGSLGQTIPSFRRSLLLSMTYEGWLFVCSLFLSTASYAFIPAANSLFAGSFAPCLFQIMFRWVFW